MYTVRSRILVKTNHWVPSCPALVLKVQKATYIAVNTVSGLGVILAAYKGWLAWPVWRPGKHNYDGDEFLSLPLSLSLSLSLLRKTKYKGWLAWTVWNPGKHNYDGDEFHRSCVYDETHLQFHRNTQLRVCQGDPCGTPANTITMKMSLVLVPLLSGDEGRSWRSVILSKKTRWRGVLFGDDDDDVTAFVKEDSFGGEENKVKTY